MMKPSVVVSTVVIACLLAVAGAFVYSETRTLPAATAVATPPGAAAETLPPLDAPPGTRAVIFGDSYRGLLGYPGSTWLCLPHWRGARMGHHGSRLRRNRIHRARPQRRW